MSITDKKMEYFTYISDTVCSSYEKLC